MNTLKIKHIGILQATKVSCALHGVLGVIYTPFLLLSILIPLLNNPTEASLGFVMGTAIGGSVILVLGMLIFGAIAGALGALFYNLIVHITGPLELKVE